MYFGNYDIYIPLKLHKWWGLKVKIQFKPGYKLFTFFKTWRNIVLKYIYIYIKICVCRSQSNLWQCALFIQAWVLLVWKLKNSKYKLNSKYRNKNKNLCIFLKTECQLGRRDPSRDVVQPKHLRSLIQF